MQLATTLELYDGFAGSSIGGRGRLAGEADPARYDAINAHCDVLVVGGGAAGPRRQPPTPRRAELESSWPMSGASSAAGRWRWAATPVRSTLTWPSWLGGPLRAAAPAPRCVGYYDDNFLTAVERRTGHLGAVETLGRPNPASVCGGSAPARVVLATGAHERLIAFANNDLPGVMLASSACTRTSRRYGGTGTRAVVFTNNDSAYLCAAALKAAGVQLAAIIDVRSDDRAAPPATVVAAGRGRARSSTVDVAPTGGGPSVRFAADLLIVSGGWNPAVQLFSQGG